MKGNFRKNLLLVLFTMPLLFAFQCDEDYYKPDNIVENSNLMEIQDSKDQFLVNDYIFIKTNIKNQQTTINDQTLSLKDFIVGGEVSLVNSFRIVKLSSENEQIPYFVENVQMLDGSIDFNAENAFFLIRNLYDSSTDSFSSNIGVQLSEAGNYLLIPDSYSDNKYQVIFDLIGTADVGSLQLKTSILSSDEEGIYRFTVE